jgi:hypothetical protein
MRAVVMRAVAKLREWGPGNCLLAVAGVLVFLVLVQGVRWGVTGRLARGLTESLKRSGDARPTRDQAKLLEEYDLILEKGILGTKRAAPPPRPAALYGIMDDRALLGSSPGDAELYKVGDEIPQGERIVEILGDEVVLEKESVRRTVSVYEAMATKRGGPGGPAGPRAASPGARVKR